MKTKQIQPEKEVAMQSIQMGSHRVHHAEVHRSGRWYAIAFEKDGPVTQGKSREDALHMAEDVLACTSDRHPGNFVAKFVNTNTIMVLEIL